MPEVKRKMDRQLKYRRLDQASPEELRELTERVNRSPWRQKFHIQPVTGLLNDPNGFSWYNGEYHLFYQWFPLGTFHGLKYWYHTKSSDLVHWENAGIGIEPGGPYDSHGAYSGSAIEKDGQLYLMYTGNMRDSSWERHPYQCMAVMNSEGEIRKLDRPVIEDVPEGYTEHFRDPKIWKDDDRYRCVIGAQSSDNTGATAVYESEDLLTWRLQGEIRTKLDKFGYMWECPDYFEMNGQGILLFCPQGLEPEGSRYQNIYQSGYITGKPLDRETLELEHGPFHELDRGFDFYAPQTMLDPDGRRILVGWMGLPEVEYPTDSQGWAHCLTLPRELVMREGKLLQRPVKELEQLRRDEVSAEGKLTDERRSFPGMEGSVFEMICDFSLEDADAVGVRFREGNGEHTDIRYDARNSRVIMDRTLSGEKVGSTFGSTRSCSMAGRRIRFHLFVDVSSVELFVNDGEEVFTSRIFPDSASRGITFYATNGSAGLKAVKWDLQQAVNHKEGME